MSIVLSRSPSAQIGIAILAVAAACATALALDGRSLALPFCVAVVVAACAGGRRIGFFATILATVAIQAVSRRIDPTGACVFVLVGFFVSQLIDKLSREIQNARGMNDLIRASEEHLRLLVDSVQDYALCLLDAEGRLTSWNAGGEKLFGYRRDDIVGRHVCCLYSDAATQAGEPIEELELARVVGKCEQREWRLRRDGTRLRVHTVMRSIHDGSGRLHGYSIVMRELNVAPSARSMTGLLDEHRRGLELALTNRT